MARELVRLAKQVLTTMVAVCLQAPMSEPLRHGLHENTRAAYNLNQSSLSPLPYRTCLPTTPPLNISRSLVIESHYPLSVSKALQTSIKVLMTRTGEGRKVGSLAREGWVTPSTVALSTLRDRQVFAAAYFIISNPHNENQISILNPCLFHTVRTSP